MALVIPGFGARFRAELEAFIRREGLRTQGEVAQRFGAKQQSVSNWKKGTTPDYKNLVSIAAAFGCPWQWLLLGDDVKEAYRFVVERERRAASGQAQNTGPPEPARAGKAPPGRSVPTRTGPLETEESEERPAPKKRRAS